MKKKVVKKLKLDLDDLKVESFAALTKVTAGEILETKKTHCFDCNPGTGGGSCTCYTPQTCNGGPC